MAIVTIITPAAQVPTVAGVGQQAGSATEAGTPAPALHLGSLVSGTIAGNDGGGNYQLRTSQGTLTLQSSTPLTYNSDVTIRIDASNAGTTSARIITVNGEPFASFSAPVPAQGDTVSPGLLQTQSPPSSASQAALPPAPVPAQSEPVNALVVSPASAQQVQTADTGAANTPVANGTPVVIRVTATPQATTQQSSTTAITPQPARTDSPATAPAVQAQTGAQQIAQDQTPANVAKLVAPQPATLEQNPPSPATPQTSGPAASPLPETSQAPVQAPNNALYAAYTKPATFSAPQAPASASSASATTPVLGQVINANTDGTVSVRTPLGVVTVQPSAPSALQPGTSVSVELPAASLPQTQALPALAVPQPTTPAPLQELATSWATLKDVLTIVAAADPAVPGGAATPSASPAASALMASLPQIGSEFAASSLTFISAMLQGDARKILGDTVVATLRANNRADLIEKFAGELTSLSQNMNANATRPAPTWQAMFLPFVYQDELQQARLYVKREPPKKDRASGGNQAKGDTRFIVEVDLSETGPLQMDGLVRSKQQTTVFDLMIRSQSPFARADQLAIAAIYRNAAQLTGFSGSLAFQVMMDFPVKPLDEVLTGDRSITV